MRCNFITQAKNVTISVWCARIIVMSAFRISILHLVSVPSHTNLCLTSSEMPKAPPIEALRNRWAACSSRQSFYTTDCPSITGKHVFVNYQHLTFFLSLCSLSSTSFANSLNQNFTYSKNMKHKQIFSQSFKEIGHSK